MQQTERDTDDLSSPITIDMQRLGRALSEPFAFVLMQWPAIMVLLMPSNAIWFDGLKIAAGIWLAFTHLAAYGGGRGAGFGNSMVMLSACFAASIYTHPSAWMWLWLVLVVIGLLASQRLRLRTLVGNVETQSSERK